MSLTGHMHQLVAGTLLPGSFAIDATAGNGHDTQFLADCVGLNGAVLAIDLQQAAIDSAKARVSARQVTWACGNHADLRVLVNESWIGHVSAVMFNLGYLPGGDHSIITESSSTIAAILASFDILQSGGVISLMVYQGHDGALPEVEAVEQCVTELSKSHAQVFRHTRIGAEPHAPYGLLIQKH